MRTLALLAALVSATAAAAQETGIEGSEVEETAAERVTNAWGRFEYGFEFHGMGVDLSALNNPRRGEAIYSTDATKPGLMLTCSKNAGYDPSLNAVVSLAPMDFSEAWGEQSRHRRKFVRMTIGDRPTDARNWLYAFDAGTLQTMYYAAAAKAYNASVRGDPIRLKLGGMDEVTIIPPPVDDVFLDFGAACGLGRYAEKDAD